MSQELERVYTINLGKALISQSQHRAVRAINMIKEFARHHMKVEDVKIEEDLAHQIWSKGVRSPPRKVRVRMNKTDEGYVLVSPYEEEVESKKESKEFKKDSKKETKKVEGKVEPATESAADDKKELETPKKEEAKPAKKESTPAPKKEEAKPAKKESKPAAKKAKPAKSK